MDKHSDFQSCYCNIKILHNILSNSYKNSNITNINLFYPIYSGLLGHDNFFNSLKVQIMRVRIQKMRSLAQKIKKLWAVEFSQKSVKFTKAFGLHCADFAQFFFKSHAITKYEKSRSFVICLLFEKMSHRASKKVWVLRTPPLTLQGRQG